MKIRVLLPLLAAALVACGGPEAAPPAASADPLAASPAPSSAASATLAVVDSARTGEQSLAAFRRTVSHVPARLEPAATSRDALVRGFVRALETSDTAFFRAHGMSRGEFAYFFYPESEFIRPPRELPADFVWFYLQQDSEKGIGRALARHGGQPLGYVGYACAPEPRVLGRSRLWEQCELRRVVAGDTLRERWFGSILERDGRFKFVSYANRF